MFICNYTQYDCAELAGLFYNTVYTVNAKDYQGRGLLLLFVMNWGKQPVRILLPMHLLLQSLF